MFPHVALLGFVCLAVAWYLTVRYGNETDDSALRVAGPVMMIVAIATLGSTQSLAHRFVLLLQGLVTTGFGSYMIYKYTADGAMPFSGWNGLLKFEGPLLVVIGLLSTFSEALGLRKLVFSVLH